MTLTSLCTMVARIVPPPGVPVATHGLPSLNTINGEMVDWARLPGSILLPRLEDREPQSKLPSESLSRKPAPGAGAPNHRRARQADGVTPRAIPRSGSAG